VLTGVHFLLTYRCTHQCDHCFVRSGPFVPGTFTAARVREVLDQAVEVGTVTGVYFEGGEPFLYYPVLLDGLRAARERGLDAGVVTNSYWAESIEDAELWLRPLVDAGMTELAVSDDPLHHGEEGESPAKRALEAARRIGIPSGSICIDEAVTADDVRLRGRAADRLAEGRSLRPVEEFTECPDEDLADPGRVHVDAYGNVHLCQGVLMGNLFETRLAELLRDYDPTRHPIAGPLLRGGPAALAAEHGVKHEPEHPSACHLCYRVRQTLEDRFPDHLAPPQLYDDS
jgi:MoaA/NifB/PqqE/SkfB family radical SAM enzyme